MSVFILDLLDMQDLAHGVHYDVWVVLTYL